MAKKPAEPFKVSATPAAPRGSTGSGKDDLSKLIASIQDEMKGGARIQAMHDVRTPYGIRRPTGIADLDNSLNGGFAAGTLNQVFGPDGAGKDLLTNHIIAENQRVHGEKANAFWMTFGYRPDLPFMRMAGVKIRKSPDELRQAGIDPETATEEQWGEEVGNTLFVDLGSLEAMENPSEVLLSTVVKLVRSNQFQIGIINELGAGETKDSVKKDLHEDARMATWANLMTNFCQKFYSAMRQPGDDLNETTLFMVLPVRANLDAYSAKFTPHSQTGGYALKHAKVVDLHVRAGKTFKNKDGAILYKEINWKIGKGKLGIAEGAEGTYTFVPGQGIDLLAGTVNVAKEFGLIRRQGPFYYILDYEDRISGGMEGVQALIKDSPKLQEELREAVRLHVASHKGG